jgi:hypothetical protein
LRATHNAAEADTLTGIDDANGSGADIATDGCDATGASTGANANYSAIISTDNADGCSAFTNHDAR